MVLNKQTKADGNPFKITVGLHGVITVSLIKHGRCFQYQNIVFCSLLWCRIVLPQEENSSANGQKYLPVTTDKKQTVNIDAVIYWPATCKCLPMGKVKIMIV